MTLAATQTVVRRWQKKLFVKPETAFDTFDDASSALGTAEALDNESFEAGITRPKNEDNSNTGTAGRPKPTEGRDDGSWSYDVAMRPSGAAGTPPQEHQLLFALFGDYVNAGGTSDTYSFDSTVKRCLTLFEDDGDIAQIHKGALINSGKLSFDGAGNVAWEFEGKHATTLLSGTDALNGAITDVATNMTVDDASKYDEGTRILIEAEIVLVGTIDYGSNVIQITRGHSGTSNVAHSDNVAVTGLKPSHALIGAKIVRPVTLTLDDGEGATAVDIISGFFMVDKKLKEFNDETGTVKMTGGEYDVKKVSLEITMRLYRDQLYLLNGINRDLSFAGVLQIGNTAGRTATVTMPTLVGLKAPIEEGDNEVIVTRTFEAFENAGDDEATFVFT